jgi:endonuclease YncB( thermonuclease family)
MFTSVQMPHFTLAFRFAVAAICSLQFAVAQAEAFLGTVVGIADGDTLTVLTNEKQEVKVRLAEIDAPERHQPYGARAKQSLSELCFGKQAEVLPRVKDRYKRTVARIKCSGVDANTEQVKRGMAWVYRRYARDHNLYVMQHDAKAAKRGLWSDSSPVPPWEFRKQRQRHVRQV